MGSILLKKIVLIGLLLLAGCSDSVQVTDLGPVKKPEGHDRVSQDAREVAVRKAEIPPEVRARFGSVEVSIGVPKGSKTVRLEVPLDGRAEDAAAGVVVEAKDYVPAFMIVGGAVTSKNDGTENPAVWLDVQVRGKKVFSGWAFRDYPDLTPSREPGYDVRLLRAKRIVVK